MTMTAVVGMPIQAKPSGSTPLQRILGFEAAEETYDLLDFREQLIIDLRIAGWSQHEIGEALGLSQGWVSIIFKRIRFNLAESNLRQTLEIRAYYKETTTVVKGDPGDRSEDGNDNY
jgi:DNA-binding NarL/FixJ family response regulator